MVPVKTTTGEIARELYKAIKDILEKYGIQANKQPEEVVGVFMLYQSKDGDIGLSAIGQMNPGLMLRAVLYSLKHPVQEEPTEKIEIGP